MKIEDCSIYFLLFTIDKFVVDVDVNADADRFCGERKRRRRPPSWCLMCDRFSFSYYILVLLFFMR